MDSASPTAETTIRLLNPILFAALQRALVDNTVTVRRPGERRVERRRPDPYTPGRTITEVSTRGEEYAAHCPFCGDNRLRMMVNHQYHWDGPRRSLWHCYNEKCHEQPAYRDALAAVVREKRPLTADNLTVAVAGPVRAAGPLRMPTAEQLADLSWNHPAVSDLRERHFDAGELNVVWSVTFAPPQNTEGTSPGHRLLVPIMDLGNDVASGIPRTEIVGWQARSVSYLTPDTAPTTRYLTMPGLRVGRLFYGLPQAAASLGPLVIVEGVTDVWRYGPGAVALFGKSLNPEKARRLLPYVTDRPVVLLLDADAQVAEDPILEILKESLPGVTVVAGELPSGRGDPGECTREELQVCVWNAVTDLDRVPAWMSVPGLTACGVEYLPEEKTAPSGMTGGGWVRAARLTKSPNESVLLLDPRWTGRLSESCTRVYRDAVAARIIEMRYGLARGPFEDLRTVEGLLSLTDAALPEDLMSAALRGELDPLLDAAGVGELYRLTELPAVKPLALTTLAGVPIDRVKLDILLKAADANGRAALQAIKRHLTAAGRVHPVLDARGTKTGRITCRNPALQSLPKTLRSVVAAPEGRLLIELDFRAYELRLAAGLSEDPRLCELLTTTGDDDYNKLGSLLLNLPSDQLDEASRADCKEGVLSALNGRRSPIGAAFLKAFPIFDNWQEAATETARQRDVIQTPGGRPVPVNPTKSAIGQAMTALIQGGGAEYFKRALVRVLQALPPGAWPVLPMHDGLLIEADAHTAGETARVLAAAFGAEPVAGVPMPVRARIGPNWAAMG